VLVKTGIAKHDWTLHRSGETPSVLSDLQVEKKPSKIEGHLAESGGVGAEERSHGAPTPPFLLADCPSCCRSPRFAAPLDDLIHAGDFF
jgi:hypothetical protein